MSIYVSHKLSSYFDEFKCCIIRTLFYIKIIFIWKIWYGQKIRQSLRNQALEYLTTVEKYKKLIEV